MALASDPADLLLRDRMAEALQLEPVPVTVTGAATLESPYPVTDFAAASIATAGVALAGLLDALDLGRSTVTVRRELSEGWFAGAVRPVGWSPPPPWDAIAGDYSRLGRMDPPAHERPRAPRRRAPGSRGRSGARVGRPRRRRMAGRGSRDRDRGRGRMRGGHAVACGVGEASAGRRGRPRAPRRPQEDRPGGRLLLPLAGHQGASARRVARARPDSRARRTGGDSLAGRARRRRAARRPARLGGARARSGHDPRQAVGAPRRARPRTAWAGSSSCCAAATSSCTATAPRRSRTSGSARRCAETPGPGLVDVSLDAYGHTGPWAGRRGFDSLVQMSSGIAEAGMRADRGRACRRRFPCRRSITPPATSRRPRCSPGSPCACGRDADGGAGSRSPAPPSNWVALSRPRVAAAAADRHPVVLGPTR